MNPLFAVTYELLTLAIAAAITLHAAFGVVRLLLSRGFSLRNKQTEIRPASNFSPQLHGSIALQDKVAFAVWPLLAQAGWLSVGIGMLILWPECLDIFLYPRRSFFFFAGMMIFPYAIKNSLPGSTRVDRIWKFAANAFFFVAVIASLGFAAQYLLFVRPRMESPDFYYYVCTARHMASAFQDLSMDPYFYFPGVYAFWRVVLALTDGTLEPLQWWYFGVVVANALLVGGVVHAVIRNRYASVVAVLWYISFCSRFEGFIGATESISTLPSLLALLVWRGQPLAGRQGMWRTLALGIGFGLSVYIRQQAGLIALGSLSFCAIYLAQDRNNQIVSLRSLVLLPVVAALVFVLAILLEGYGLQPLWLGIKDIPSYGSKVDLGSVLWHSARLVKPLALVSLFAALFWIICFLRPRWRSFILQPWNQMLGFTIIAGLFSLIPFFSRIHLHYGLVSGPFLIIASCLFVTHLVYRIPSHFRNTPLVRFALVVLILLPFVQLRSTSPYFYLWPPDKPVRPPQQRPWRLTPGLSTDIEFMKPHVQGDHIYVLPPRQNDLHFFLETRHSIYGWGRTMPLSRVIKARELSGVLVVKPHVLPDYVVTGSSVLFDYDRAPQILASNNFQPVVDLKTMTLWRKSVRKSHATPTKDTLLDKPL